MRHSSRPPRFSRNALSAAVLSALASMAQALPQGGNVAAGSGSITSAGSNLTVNQGTQKLIVDWQSFGIAAGESVQFVQPSASAVALNRVLGNNRSEIFGSLSANGQVFLTNPNGILFGATAQVDVGGLVASTLAISNEDFLSGNYVFSGEDGGAIRNQGTLQARDGGVIALLAPEVRNEGLILAKAGAIGLGAGTKIKLDFASGLSLEVEESALNAVIENHHAVRAEGGVVILSASAQQALLGGMINNSGVIEAGSVTEAGGVIRLTAGLQSLGGSLNANGTNGGDIALQGNSINQFGVISANGSSGSGGRIAMDANAIVQTDAARLRATGRTTGGQIHVQGRESVLTSGTLDASGRRQGGSIELLGDVLTLASATLDARGRRGGGDIHVGGDLNGEGLRQRASSVWINPYTLLNASARRRGNGGTVVVWSDGSTAFGGTAKAKGGRRAGDGGLIEVSGRESLQFAGMGDASARRGEDGTLLLDPKNILITEGGGSSPFQVIPLLDPSPTPGDFHGSGPTVELANGNIVQVSEQDDFAATDAGAVYLYRGTDGALLSLLTGGQADDRIGIGGVTALSNGNFVVSSYLWDNGGADAAGATTWGSGTTGVSGVVSAANSLVGDQTNDFVGNGGIRELTNGNYLVHSPDWNNGSAIGAGAVTWGDGDSGVTGVVSAANSLVGTQTGDRLGSFSIQLLPNGNYVVSSYTWDNGSAQDAGAVTWGNGATGTTGEVSAANSLVGTQTEDAVGNQGITVLANGNYVIGADFWDNGSIENAGAAVWADGDTGITGTINAGNAFVGTQTEDRVSLGGITALTNGNYVVSSWFWNNGSASEAGAATWGNGATGSSGEVSAANSLVGTQTGDRVGVNGVTVLSNGNYVVNSPNWANGGLINAGAATWADGDSGVSGTINASNSLIGDSMSDFVGVSTIALSNGNFLVLSPTWNNGSAENAGAVTFGDGDTGITGVVSAANSLVGDATNDLVGAGGIIELANGNFVVRSFTWSNGSELNAGAVTWGDGDTGITGVVSAGNSIVGSQNGDFVGLQGDDGGIVALPNGNVVVLSPNWDNGGVSNAGAVTWGDGATGTSGEVSAANSLVGTQTDDQVGEGGLTILANSNYVVRSFSWDRGSIVDAGAVTWADGDTSITGAVSASNSLVGSSDFDFVGSFGVVALTNGNYVVRSQVWDNGSAEDAGAVTWADGDTGISGDISAANSLVGTQDFDRVGSGDVRALADGDYVVTSFEWDNGPLQDAGAITLAEGDSGVTGVVSSANSLVGTHAFDMLGSGGITELANGDVVVRSPQYDSNRGRVDLLREGTGPGFPLPGSLLFSDVPGSDVTIGTGQVTAILNTGTNLVLQANNDITVGDVIITNNPGGKGGDLTLQAGRNVFIDADIVTDNGDLTVVANERYSNGVIPEFRNPGTAQLVVAPGVSVNAGRGNVRLTVANENNAGEELLFVGDDASITAANIRLLNHARNGDIDIGSGAVLTATGNGLPLIVGTTNGGDVISADGADAAQTPNGFWLAFEVQSSRFNFALGDSDGVIRSGRINRGN
jgi:filamentous hemagglutinin family protein